MVLSLISILLVGGFVVSASLQNNSVGNKVESKSLMNDGGDGSSEGGVTSDPFPTSAVVNREVDIPSPSPTNTPAPTTVPKKVEFTTTEAIVDGAYYCYEDRVNELTRYKSLIKVKSVSADSCSDISWSEYEYCMDSCLDGEKTYDECASSCPRDDCIDRHNEVGELRK